MPVKKTFHGSTKQPDFVVAIGASAGGLEAITEVFDNMPDVPDFSFIIIQHLSSDYKSLMVELLGKHTSMKLYEAANEMKIERNCIYLIPNKYMMTVSRGRLKLHEKTNIHSPNNAIDIFFESLAIDKKDKAVGIILSGTGTDGTKGIEAIKNYGGAVIVQDPATAKFDGMPNSALATQLADMICSPSALGEVLLDFLGNGGKTPLPVYNNESEKYVDAILNHVKIETSYDFHNYKKATILRRLSKRMIEKQINSLEEYEKYIKNNIEEIKYLCNDFLIGVTEFFRDEEAFETIKIKVLPAVFKNKNPGDVVKIWVVACSSGEEAYSYAIIVSEYLRRTSLENIAVKIFATDIHNNALEHASQGIYDYDDVQRISPYLLERYFTKEGKKFRVTSDLRKLVVFAHHDVTKDPPFSKLDIISCRNMLIYVNQVLQKAVLRNFHFALNLNAFLVLGPSENIGSLKDSTKEIDRRWKIFRCVQKANITNEFPFVSGSELVGYRPKPVTHSVKSPVNHLGDLLKETLLEDHNYTAIILDKEFEVKYATGSFKKYLEFPDGNFNVNFLKMVPRELSAPLGICLRKAMNENATASLKDVHFVRADVQKLLQITVKPYLTHQDYPSPFLFMVIREETLPVSSSNGAKDPINFNVQKVEALETELRESRHNMQQLIEEIESSNEELQTTNEEIISSNEELQSTNEELQSLNEELHTVNTEHQIKIKELIDLNDDMNNYFQNTEIGQIILDGQFCIKKFTPAATKLVNLKPSDVGRNINDISNNIMTNSFIEEIETVQSGNHKIEKEVELKNNMFYSMRINPYQRYDKSRDGVVITFVDITHSKKLTSILKAVFNSSTSGITAKQAIRNKKGEIMDFELVMANSSAAKVIGIAEEKLQGKRLHDNFPFMQNGHFKTYKNVVETGKPEVFEFYYDVNEKWYEVITVKMLDGVVTTFSDITDKKESDDLIKKGYEELKYATKKLKQSNEQLEMTNMDLYQFASVASHDLKEPLRKIQAFGNLLEEKIRNKLEPSEKNYLDKIIRSSARMQNLIEDVLTFSRLSNKELPVTEVDLNNLIQSIIDDLEVSIREKNASIIVNPLPIIEAVEGQMHQLFHNLIANALKFNDSENVEIKISVKAIPGQLVEANKLDTAKYVAISVLDNGIGFEDEFSDKIFKMFQRLTPTQYQGTGIGLAICKKIVENHGGIITAESAIGKGAEFTVILPLIQT
ncbi:MAG: chemotaxis protein CheB [Ferruginibacter sp.]